MTSIVLIAAFALAAHDPSAPAPAPAPASAPAPAPAPAAESTVDEGISRTGALGILTGGLALGVTSLLAFSTGLEAERQLRSGEARGVDAQNDALTQRAVAAWVAWPTAVLSVAGVVGGGWLVSTSDGGAE